MEQFIGDAKNLSLCVGPDSWSEFCSGQMIYNTMKQNFMPHYQWVLQRANELQHHEAELHDSLPRRFPYQCL